MMGPSSEDEAEPFANRLRDLSRQLPDEYMEYAIYIINEELDTAHERSRLQEINNAGKGLRKKHLKDYIWQREEFFMELVYEEGKWALHGKTNFGDCVVDEWLIVWLLRELSQQFEDVWIRAYDSQGEFLFIEAAKALPQWLDPETGGNRAWIHNGQLILIPLQENRPPESLTIAEALSLISSPSFQLMHSRSMEVEAFRRLPSYPEEIQNNRHHTIITIPRKLAHFLHQNPSYIAPAVEAYYLRDPISLKHVQAPNPSTLRFPPLDLVTVSVRFTKYLYVQIQSQQFAVPPAWAAAIPSILNAAGKEKTEWGQQNAKALARAETGMKVTCGFEMLLRDSHFRSRKKVQEMQILLEDIESGEEKMPTDEEIKGWAKKEDDDSWINVDFNEFQKELEGRKSKDWDDQGAQKNLRSIIERFKHFMDDDKAGIEGAEDMDFDDDDSSDSEGEDHGGSFDSEEFQRKLKEYMALPARERPEAITKNMEGILHELDDDDELIDLNDEDDEIRNIMSRMESELKNAGALNLEPKGSSPSQIKDPKRFKNGRSSRIKDLKKAEHEEEEEDESDDDAEENDIDFNLAKNMMEAFKAQGGTSGPAGNMLAQMGIQLPRDEEDSD